MDGAPKAGRGGAGKDVLPLPGPAGCEAGNAGAARAARRVPAPEDAAADAPAAAVAAGAGAEEEDDEQVERFYALLDNIRAMRGAYGPSDGDGTGADGVETGGGGARKRLRAAEPPWRPTFRPEDFEEPSPTSPSDDDAARRRSKRTQSQDAAAEEGGARRTVASSPPPTPRAGSRLDKSGRKSI